MEKISNFRVWSQKRTRQHHAIGEIKSQSLRYVIFFFLPFFMPPCQHNSYAKYHSFKSLHCNPIVDLKHIAMKKKISNQSIYTINPKGGMTSLYSMDDSPFDIPNVNPTSMCNDFYWFFRLFKMDITTFYLHYFWLDK